MEQFLEFNVENWMDASGCLDLSVKFVNKVVGKVSKIAFASAVVAAASFVPSISNVSATEDIASVVNRVDREGAKINKSSSTEILARLSAEFDRGIENYLNPEHDFSEELMALAGRALVSLA